MRLYQRLLLSGLIAGCMTPACADEFPTRDDYAYGFRLSTQGDSEFFSLAVPTTVYASVTDPRLRDAGVYNASGQPVPRVFERPETENNNVERKLPLDLVALYGEQAVQLDQM